MELFYEEALAVELERRGIGFDRQRTIDVTYKDELVGSCRVDFVVAGELVVELKSVDAIAAIHVAQTLSYLRAGGFELGLILNFNVPFLKQGIRRVVWSSELSA